MKQLTIRIVDPELEDTVRQLAETEGLSLNQAVVRLLRKGAGLERPRQDRSVVGTSLDDLIGTWSDRDAEEFLEAIRDFDGIDESLWK